jgi:LuxR family maltose regulon positive regulatory protein
MAGPLIETEVHVPRRRRGVAARPRLAERLHRAEESSPALVSAPARFRKTTLLTEWPAAAVPAPVRPVAWPSLDERGDDLYTRPARWRR